MSDHLRHIDSSIKTDASVSRALTARAARVWSAARPGGTVTYRDLGVAPLPHLDPATMMTGLLGGREILVLASRGGGYSPGTPVRAGITPSRGSPTPSARSASNRTSSPPS